MKMKSPSNKLLYALFAFLTVAVSYFIISKAVPKPSEVRAEGVYHQINNGVGANGGYDAISWAPSNPLMIDAYGNYISVAQHFTEGFKFIFNNDAGAGDWAELDVAESLFRPTAVYDANSDQIHLIQSGGSFEVTYKRYNIVRDVGYNIVDIVLDSEMSELLLDGIDTCTSFDSNHPLAFIKDDGAGAILVAMWSVSKTCGGSDFVHTRGAMRDLSYDSEDGNSANWVALDGTDDNTLGPEDAQVANSILYQYNGVYSHSVFQHAALIAPDGSNVNDIYYFNTDENDTNGFIRLAWDGVDTDWSGGTSVRQVFGGDVGNSSGYNLKQELISKPAYSSVGDRVYIGIARWLDGTNGDTQSLFYVDNTDTITLAGNVYSAGETGTPAHCLYPTLDIMGDSANGDVYVFYDISGTTDCGHVEYVIYDGTNFSVPETYYSVASNSIDIPVTYYDRYEDRILLLYRRNDSVSPESPPHYIDFGYLELDDASPPPSTTISSGYIESLYSELDTQCSESYNGGDTQVVVDGNGDIALKSLFRHDFEIPRGPYDSLFTGWVLGNYSGGSYAPTPTGSINVRNSSSGGAFQYTAGSGNIFTRKTLESRAFFALNGQFQHVGYVNDENFSQFIMFSTMSSNTNLYARYHDGTTTENFDLGTGYRDGYHDFKIEWEATRVIFLIDGVEVHNTEDTVGLITTYNSPLGIMLSNNTDSTDLLVDYVDVQEYTATVGTYTSCIFDSAQADSTWISAYDPFAPVGTSITLETRTSEDKITWSVWELQVSNLVSSPPARYLQYRATLNGTSVITPLFRAMTLYFGNAPDDPSNLGPVEVVDGGYINDVTPTLQFTTSDPDVGDSLQFLIEISTTSDFSDIVTEYSSDYLAQGANSFTVGQPEGSGSYSVGSEGQTLFEGGYYWRVSVEDQLGLGSGYTVANSGLTAFNIDTTAPEVNSVNSSTPNGNYGISDDINISVNFSENVTSSGNITVNLDSGGSCTFTVSNAPSGSCVYTVASGHESADLNNTTITGTVVDRADNPVSDFIPVTDLATNKDIVIDGVAPAAFVPELNVTSPTMNNTPTLTFSTTDNTGIDHYEVRIDSGSYVSQTSPYVLPTLADGSHSIRVRAFDAAGNYTEGTVLNLTVDTTAPDTFTPDITGGTPTTDTTPTITFSTSDAGGINYYQVKIDSGSFSTQGSPYTLPEQAIGNHTITVRAYDLAGNYRDGILEIAINEASGGSTTSGSTTGGAATSGSGTTSGGSVPPTSAPEDEGATPTAEDENEDLDPELDEENESVDFDIAFLNDDEIDISSNPLITTEDSRPVLSGTTKPGYPVEVVFTNGDEKIYCNTVADSDGYWSCRPSEELEVGVVYGVSITSSKDGDTAVDGSFRLRVEEESNYMPYIIGGGLLVTLILAFFVYLLAKKRR